MRAVAQPVSDDLCCDEPVTDIDTDPVRTALGRRAAGDGGGRIRPAPPRRGLRRSPQRGSPAPAVRAKSTPDRPRHRRRHRNRAAAARPAGRTAARRTHPRRGGRRSAPAVRRAADVGARPDRRHGQLRLRHPGVRGVGGRPGRRTVGGRCRRQRRRRRAVLRGAAATARTCGATASTTPLRCSPVDDLSMSLVGTGFGYEPAAAATAGARCWPRCCREVRDVRRIGSARSTCAWWPRDGSTRTTRTASHVWDWAAGALIAAEAGASLRLPPADGRQAGLIVAAAPGIAEALDDALRAQARCSANTARANGIGSAGRGVDLLTAASDRRAGWRRVAGWPAPRRCRRCGSAR